MGSGLVVVTPPVLNYDFGIDPVPEPLKDQAFVAELAVEAFPGSDLLLACSARAQLRKSGHRGAREFCENQSCIVLHRRAIHATDARLTC